jgi:hypothetical protein
MKLKTKINLIKKLKLQPEQIIYLESLNISFDFENELLNDDVEFVIKSLNIKLQELVHIDDEQNCLNLAYIISVIEHNELRLEFDFENNSEIDTDDFFNDEKYENDNQDENEFIDQIEGLTAKEQKKLQREAVIKYKEIDGNTIINELKNFVVKKYPQIINGFDRSIYSSAKLVYWKKEHIFDFWQIPTKIYEKIKEAEYEVEQKLREEVVKNGEKMYTIWAQNYKIWLAENGLTKSTKVNIKDYFKSIKVKPTETIVERIKENYRIY